MQTLDLNLARRPFRNNTLLWVGYGLAFLLLGMFSFWTASRFVEARREVSRIVDTEVNFDTRMAELKQRNDRVLAAVKSIDLGSLSMQSGKANEVIAWKSFSWTRLFNAMEKVQPHDVRLISIRPMFRAAAADAGEFDVVRSVPVAVEGIARTFTDLTTFHQALQDDPHFSRIEPLNWRRTDKREIKYQLRFRYSPEIVEAPVDAAQQVADADAEAAAPDAGAATAAVVEPSATGEVADDSFAGTEPEEARSEPSATDRVQRRIERPKAAAQGKRP